MYDAIIVGARCAGSPTAMLLARQGFKVLLVDRATFPSDTISTHILWPHGAEILARWGLLDTLAATGAPPICRRMTFDVGPFALRGTIPDANDGMGGFCPRRTVLDSLLVNAAAESGVEVREGFTVDELLVTGDTVVGVRGHGKSGDSSRGAGPDRHRRRRRELLRRASGASAGVRRAPGGRLLLLLVLQRRRAGRHRAVRARPLRVWRRADQRRSPSRDGELAGQRLSGRPRRHRGSRLAGARVRARLRCPRARGPSRRKVVRHGRRARVLPQAVWQRMGARRRRQLQPRSDYRAGHQRRIHRRRDARRGAQRVAGRATARSKS